MVVGVPGIEPRTSEPESDVLPVRLYSNKLRSKDLNLDCEDQKLMCYPYTTPQFYSRVLHSSLEKISMIYLSEQK